MALRRLNRCLRYFKTALPFAALLAVCLHPAHAGQPLYAITDLARKLCIEPGPGLPSSMTGAGINQHGDVRGNLLCTSSGTAYLYNNATDQVSIIAIGSTVFAINNKQQIAGVHFRGGNFPLVYSGGRIIEIVAPMIEFNAAFDLNNNGVVVGEVFGHAFKWKAGSLIDLDRQLGGKGSIASAINDRNEITGISNAFEAFLLSPAGRVTQLGTLGGSTTTPQAINIYSEITGCSKRADGTTHAFLWQTHRMHDLGLLGTESCGLGINSDGAVVGCTLPPEFPRLGGCVEPNVFQLPASLALLWKDDAVYDLNGLIDRGDPLYGSIALYSATGINDAGQIVVNGCFTAGTSKGRCTTVRLDPVTEVAASR
jgi:probable HAF family extracellular repeat protein